MKILLSLALLLSSFPLFGQATTGYHRVSQVIARSNTGTTALVVPFAKIAVTNTATGNAAVIYFDPLLSSQISPPLITADLAGNYSYYMPLNTCVTETISSPGQSNITIPNICGNPASSVLLETNGVNNASQSLLNLVAGTGIVLSNTGGAVTINAQAGSGVTSINTVAGDFTFSGSGVSCSGTTCTFSGGGGGSPGGSNHSVQFNSSGSFAGTAFNGLVKASTTADPVAATAGVDFQAPITLTTTGTSGAATFIGNTLNVPQYAGTTYSAGTGLTLTGSTFSVNTSQNIATLSNLTSNGFVKTSGGTGTLSVDTTVYAPLASPTFTGTVTTPALTLSTATGSTQCLQVNSSGVVAPTGTACGSGGGGITALTGDGTASGSGSVAFTLATVNTNVGSFGSSTSIPSFTVNGKGLITAASGNVVIAPAGTLSGTTLNSTVVSSSLTSLGTIISLLASNITDSALTSGHCVQASTAGLLSTISVACGTGNGTVTSVSSANGDITVATGTTTPVLTAVSAPKWDTARLLAGNSVDGSANVAFTNKFIVQGTSDSGLTGAQFMGALATGLVKNTTTTGVQSIATDGTDYLSPSTGLSSLTGDVTTSAHGAAAATLATVNSNTGACGDATHVCQVTLNGKGLATAATAVSITASPSGSAGGALTGSYPNPTIAGLGSTAGFLPKTDGAGDLLASPFFIDSDGYLNLPIGGINMTGSHAVGGQIPGIFIQNTSCTSDVSANVDMETDNSENALVIGHQNACSGSGLAASASISFLTQTGAYHITPGTSVYSVTNSQLTSNVVTLTAVNSLSAGEFVRVFNLTSATFLNNQNYKVLTASGTQFTFAFTHANTGSAAESGNAEQVQDNQLDITNEGGGIINFGFTAQTPLLSVRTGLSTNGVFLPTLPSQTCLGTDSNGLVGAGTCSGGTSTIIQVNGTPTTTATPVNLQNSSTNATGLALTVSNPSVGNVITEITGNVNNANLATQTANTVLGALTATTPSGLAMPSCSGATNALIWTSGTGFGCNTIASGITFPQTVGGTTTSGGIPYFSSTTVLTSSALLPTGDFVLGGGAGGAPTASFSVVPVANGGTAAATFAAHSFFGNPTASTAAPAASLIGVNDWSPNAYVTGAGSVNVMTATLAPVATAYTAGLQVDVLPNLANTTTTPTLNVNGLGAKTITKCGTTALVAGDYTTTAVAEFVYDGTRMQLVNPQAVGCGSVTLAGDVTGASGTNTVVKVNGGSVPVSAGLLGTNGSSQPVSATGLALSGVLTCSDTSASGTAQTCTTSPSFTPAANSCVIYTTTTANTGAGLTLNVNSLGAKSVAKWLGTTTLAANDVKATSPQLACYNGTVWNLSTIGNAPSGGGGAGLLYHSFVSGSVTVAASNTYMVGSDGSWASVAAAGNGWTYFVILKTGTITSIDYQVRSPSTGAISATCSMSLATTSGTILTGTSATTPVTGGGLVDVQVTGLSTAVTAGDKIQVQFVVPAGATPATSVVFAASVEVD